MSIIDNNWMYEQSTTGINKDVETIITGDTDSDYVKVVRCKDCCYYSAGFFDFEKASPLMSGSKVVGMCHTFNGLQSPMDDDFCSRGKRRDTE